MKIEMDNNTSSVVSILLVGSFIVSVILGIAYLIYDSSVKSNAALAQAKSCEEMVVLKGGAEVPHALLACKLQVQPAAPVINDPQSGK